MNNNSDVLLCKLSYTEQNVQVFTTCVNLDLNLTQYTETYGFKYLLRELRTDSRLRFLVSEHL